MKMQQMIMEKKIAALMAENEPQPLLSKKSNANNDEDDMPAWKKKQLNNRGLQLHQLNRQKLHQKKYNSATFDSEGCSESDEEDEDEDARIAEQQKKILKQRNQEMQRQLELKGESILIQTALPIIKEDYKMFKYPIYEGYKPSNLK